MGNILNKLRDYLNQTTPEQRQQDWEALKEWNNVGSFASDYIEYCLTTQQNSTIKYSSVNQNLDFSLDFGFSLIHSRSYEYKQCILIEKLSIFKNNSRF